MKTILTLVRWANFVAATPTAQPRRQRFGVTFLGTLVLLCVCAVSSIASPIGYVINGSQFGAVDVGTGVFHQIGPDFPEGSEGLAAGPNGRFYTIGFSGELYSIDSATGMTTPVGPTGLDDCSTPTSPCGRTSSLTLGSVDGNLYATDFDNNIYAVDPATGAATKIGLTGIPGVPFIPGPTTGGILNIYEQTLFGAAGQLYSTFTAFVLDPGTGVVNMAAAPSLYRINPSTGVATLVAPLMGPNPVLAINGIFGVNGTLYGFDNFSSHIINLNLQTGGVSFTGQVDPSAGIIRGAQAVPEPASVALTGLGVALFFFGNRRRGNRQA
jgi:hypothetical protein